MEFEKSKHLKFNIQEELKNLPDKPGVYIMKDKRNKVIYVGKAIVLKNRVRQYFQDITKKDTKTQALVSNIYAFEYIITDTEMEALILECTLIKQYKPHFNILMKDDKTYPHIKVTINEDFPKVIITRKMKKDGAKYYGVYSSSFAVKQTLELIKKVFPIRTCDRVLPRDIGKQRECLNFHIGRCLAPCKGNIDKQQYRNVVTSVCEFLEGKHEDVIKQFEDKMRTLAENLQFEEAAALRDKIKSISHIAQRQKVYSTDMKDMDVISIIQDEMDSCVQLLFIRNGKLIGTRSFIYQGTQQDAKSDILNAFLTQYYNNEQFVPSNVFLQYEIADMQLIEDWMSKISGHRVYLRVPVKGEKRKLVLMAAKNADASLRQYKDNLKRTTDMNETVKILAQELSLETIPRRIEAYDISNTGTSEVVASMVVFLEGIPQKNHYRRFKLNAAEYPDDYGCMKEVLHRRLKHLDDCEESNESFKQRPDLILLDGGMGHVNAVREVLKEAGSDINVLGMVKNDKHRSRGLIDPIGKEYELKNSIVLLRFITAIQNEAHRFALEYNKKLREKRYNKSVLDDIEGIGNSRKKSLIKYFGSIKKIQQAEIEELVKIEGISRTQAQRIYDHFHNL